MAANKSTRTNNSKPAPRKHKSDSRRSRVNHWHQKGRKDALMYWQNMETEPQQEHMFGYLAVLACEAHTEAEELSPNKTIDIVDDDAYVTGFSEVMQAKIEDLMRRASIFDGVVAAARKGVRHGQN